MQISLSCRSDEFPLQLGWGKYLPFLANEMIAGETPLGSRGEGWVQDPGLGLRGQQLAEVGGSGLLQQASLGLAHKPGTRQALDWAPAPLTKPQATLHFASFMLLLPP